MRSTHVLLCLVLALFSSACGDDAASVDGGFDSGLDARVTPPDASPAPRCGATTCGSPLVGVICCTGDQDVLASVAVRSGACGVNLGALEPQLVGRCVQLRQPGQVDTSCPSRRVGALVEPGCCTSAGICGTLNAAVDLGCQTALSPATASVYCGPMWFDGGSDLDGG